MFLNFFRSKTQIDEAHYQFPINTKALESPTEKELSHVQKQLGNKIKLFEGETPKRLSDAAIVGGAVALALLSPVLAIPFGIFGALHLMKPDYDSSESRLRIMKEIASNTFSEIVNRHSAENVMGYRLLDKIPTIRTSTKKAFYYATFQKLANEHKHLEAWHKDEKEKVDNSWLDAMKKINPDPNIMLSPSCMLKATAPLTKWKEGELKKIEKTYESTINILNEAFEKLVIDNVVTYTRNGVE